ncbi:MAG: hypothetical protein WA826_06275 [Silvibacterium sp.]
MSTAIAAEKLEEDTRNLEDRSLQSIPAHLIPMSCIYSSAAWSNG